jgi:hypothetical protein
MKYKIKKYVRPNGKPHVFPDEHDNKCGPWYVSVRTDKGQDFGYVWKNGNINGSCEDESGHFPGWYNTREAARKAVRIRKALDKQQTVS